MAARGPPPSLSIPAYPQGGGSSDSFRGRGRGRNRSGGSSGASSLDHSRDHSVEGRRDNARRGSGTRGGGGGEFRASYHAQYEDARRVPDGHAWNDARGRIGSGPPSQSWGVHGVHNANNWNQGGGGHNPNNWSQGGGGHNANNWNQGGSGHNANNWNQGGGAHNANDWNQGGGGHNANNWNQGGGGHNANNWSQGGGSNRSSSWGHAGGGGDNGNNWSADNGKNWSHGGRGNNGNNWRSNRGDLPQMRVQGVFKDDGGARHPGALLASRPTTRGYALSIGSQQQASHGADPRQQGNEQQRNRNNNSRGGYERQDSDGRERQEIVGFGAGDESSSSRARNWDGGRGYGRAAAAVRGGRSPFAGGGRLLPKLIIPKDDVFGDSRELQTFGSPGGLTRKTALLSPRDSNVNVHWGDSTPSESRNLGKGGSLMSRDGDVRANGGGTSGGDGWSNIGGFRDTQIQSRRSELQQQDDQVPPQRAMASYGNRNRQLQRQNSQSQQNIILEDQQREKFPSKKRNDDSVSFHLPSPGSSKRSHGRNNSSFEKKREESGEFLFASPSSRKGSFDRDFILGNKIEEPGYVGVLSPSSSMGSGRNSVERKKRDEELPVFSPSRMGEFGRQHSRRMSRQSSFTSEVFKTLDDEVSRNAEARQQQRPTESAESASAGMHRTRSTDWYEICLKEEEEEQQLLASAKRVGQEDVRRFALANNGEEVNDNFDRGRARLQERLLARGDDAQRNTESRGKEGGLLFTPWNSLQSPGSNTSHFRPKSLYQSFEKTSGEPAAARDGLKCENLRVSIGGGKGAAGRRVINVVDNDVAERWRPERGVQQNRAGRKANNAIDTEGSERPKQERRPGREEAWRRPMSATGSGKTQNFIQGKRPETLQEESTVGRPGESNDSLSTVDRPGESKDSLSAVDRPGESKDPLSGPAEPGAITRQQKVNLALRPGALYRAFMDGEDEPLPHIVGTCPDMCPVRERLQRERLRDLAVFERVSGDMRRTSKELAVKKFCRTVMASELEQTDVRPLPVLWRTLQYLLELLDDDEFSFDIVHNFLFDRTRAIRQELGMQRILDHQSITIHEEIVRFHIVSQHELYELNRKRSKQVDTYLNLQQLSKSLHSLLNLYISLGGDGSHFESEAEFYAYYVLLNLGSHGQFQAEPLSLWFPNVPANVLHGAPMQFARKALRFYRSNNYVGFFRLVREATYLQSCLLELNFDSIRATALSILNVSEYKLHPFPFVDLAEMLILAENEVEELCIYYGLLTGVDNSSEKRCLLVKQAQFVTPERENIPHYSCGLVGSKRAPSFFLEVKGGNKLQEDAVG